MNNWDFPKPFQQEILIRPEDIDGLGHANNACYVLWCEQVAWQHSEFLGLSVLDYQKLDRGVAIRKAVYDYYLPCFENEKIIVSTWLTDCDQKLRLQRHFQMVNALSGQTVLRGQWQLICVALSSGKASRFPSQFIDIYGGAVVEKSMT